ncbi:hypothetical protein AV530_019306 [Patagioenas fasciata monilis]|uniref:unspecific monooxygenase n=1 Tax=Patagioenas fasciata monilis TaxID=372326 RepID=A0A1V4JCU0_PATFA|nr:hypothetical protein AV530_019306 [Patagioenas fasciata monilis]
MHIKQERRASGYLSGGSGPQPHCSPGFPYTSNYEGCDSLWQHVPQGLKSPPGPRGIPILGNVLELRKDPHLVLTRLSKKYGDVMEVRIGTRPVLVLSGLDTIRQALVKQGEDFMGRPDLYSFQYISNGQSPTFSPDSGEVWKALRKLTQNALKTFSSTPSPTSSSTCLLEEHVSKEAEYVITKFLQLMEEEKRFDLTQYLHYDHNDQELLKVVNFNNEFGEDINRRFGIFVEKIVQEHYISFDKGHIRDITDSLIERCQEKSGGEDACIPISNEKIIAIVHDLFGAGFDTVTTALSWSLMYVALYPDIQKKIQDELDQHIGRERRPRLSDRGSLPYTEAFILEMFRHSSFLPFTIPHSTTKTTVLNGYYIPKGTCVFINQWQVNHDEKLWKDPSAFNPERFLNAAGTEINRTESDKVLIFGLGKRRCIGESIGRWEVFLFLTILLQQLEFSLRPGEEVDITPQYGLTMKYKKCESFQIKKRFPMKSSL